MKVSSFQFRSIYDLHCRQRTGLGDGGEIYILSPERQPNKELKYRISTKVQQRIFSPELLMNSEQKADEMHVSPAIAKPTVSSWHFCQLRKHSISRQNC